MVSGETVDMDYYGRIKHLAKQKLNLSLQEFLFSVELKPDSYYSLKEAGNFHRADEALKIAKALNTSIEYLLTGTEQKKDPNESLLDDMQAVIDKHRKASPKK